MTSITPDGHDRGDGEASPGPRTRIPLGTVSVGRLRIRRGLDGTTITADPKLEDLLHGWWRREPEVTAEDGVITLTYSRFRRLARWRTDDISLNASVPWDISIQGGVHRVGADLSHLKLRSLTVGGGARRFVLVLGRPDGEVRIDLRSADQVTIRRPATAEVRVKVARGASQVAVDDQTYSAIGGETVVTTGPVLYHFYNVTVDAARRLRVTTI
jgi:hypothetical protein